MASSTRVPADALAVGPGDRAALVISHPAHELFVHAWLATTRPRVHVLTDGSGRIGRPRLDRTTRILTEAGAAPGTIYGRLTDRAVYEAVLRQDARLFLGLVRDLAYALSRDRIDYVVGDSLEGAIMTHDLWRILTGAAIELASRARRTPIENFQFVNMGSRVACVENRCASAIHLSLDAATFQRKVDAARGYDAIAEEVEELLNEHGMDAFRTECMHAVDTRAGLSGLPEEPPLWEVQAEMLVAAGCYDRVLRYREHVLPLVTAVWRCVDEELDGRVVA